MPSLLRAALLVVSLVIAASATTLLYLNIYLSYGGVSRAVCTATRVGDYLFEAYVMPATPREGEEFEIKAVVQGVEGASGRVNITLFLLKPGRVSLIDGPAPATHGVMTWRHQLSEPGLYEVTFLLAGEAGSGQINGRIQVYSYGESQLYSTLRTTSYTSLWLGIPLLAAILIYHKMSS
ncbi:MAG: hypothetical protein QXJ29_00275 [Nitrososphaerota archaeon]